MPYFKLHLNYLLENINDFFKHNIMGLNEDRVMLPKEIEIYAEYDKKTKSFYAEAVNLEGVYTATDNVEQLIKNINHQIYEHFSIPRYTYAKMGNRFTPPEKAIKRLIEEGASINIKVPSRKVSFA